MPEWEDRSDIGEDSDTVSDSGSRAVMEGIRSGRLGGKSSLGFGKRVTSEA